MLVWNMNISLLVTFWRTTIDGVNPQMMSMLPAASPM
jgi:hypothetical protein